MKHLINKLLIEKNIDNLNLPIDLLYKVGMDNVKNNIEFYMTRQRKHRSL